MAKSTVQRTESHRGRRTLLPNGASLYTSNETQGITYYFIALTAFLTQGPLNTISDTIGSVVPFVKSTWVTPMAIYIPLGLYIISLARHNRPIRILPFIFIYGLLLCAMLSTLVAHPEYRTVMFDQDWGGNINAALLSPTAAVFALLLILLAPSSESILASLTWAAYLNFAGNVVRYVAAQRRGYWIGAYSDGAEFEAEYNLGFGYSVLMSLVVFAFLALKGRRPVIHWTGAVISLFMILTGGSRAPAGVAVLAVGIFLFHFRKSVVFGSPRRAGLWAAGAALAAVVLANVMTILKAIQKWLASRGTSYRSLDKIIDGSFTEDRARDRLSGISERLINEGGAFGHGIYGDRYHIRPYFHWGYPHNIIDEFMITYGWLGGTIVISTIAIVVAAGYLRSRGQLDASLMVLVLPLTFQLWVSMSYLLSVWFWVLLALAVRSLVTNQRGQHSSSGDMPRLSAGK